MQWRGLAIVVVIIVGASGCASDDRSTPSASGGTVPIAVTYLYGEQGPAPSGDLPDRCPPPFTGTISGRSLPSDWATVYGEDLGAVDCYGPDGLFRSCGDGIGDFPGEGGVLGGDDCQVERPTGLPFAVPRSLRTSNASGVFGGECLEAAEGDALVLTDCRLPHTGKVIWGRAVEEPGQDLGGICEANAISHERWGTVQLIRDGNRYACIVIERSQA